MELKNTSCLPDYFVRALLRWACKQVGYPYRDLREARFVGRSTRRIGGRAFLRSRRIIINVPPFVSYQDGVPPSEFPRLTFEEALNVRLSDAYMQRRFKWFAEITAHEIAHLYVYWEHGSVSESEVEAQGKLIAADFEADADALLKAWSKEPVKRESKPKPTATEKRENSNRALLKKWESKMKAAQNKVKKYRAKVRYYDRKRAAKGAE